MTEHNVSLKVLAWELLTSPVIVVNGRLFLTSSQSHSAFWCSFTTVQMS